MQRELDEATLKLDEHAVAVIEAQAQQIIAAIYELYEKHNPTFAVEALCKKHAGQELALYERVCKKYHVLPNPLFASTEPSTEQVAQAEPVLDYAPPLPAPEVPTAWIQQAPRAFNSVWLQKR